MAVDWQNVRSMVYGRVEGELQRQMKLAEDNPDDFEGMTTEEAASQILEFVATHEE